MRILVVEDEPAQREVLAYNLEAEGFRVIRAATGDEALLLVDEDMPDIIVPRKTVLELVKLAEAVGVPIGPGPGFEPELLLCHLHHHRVEAPVREQGQQPGDRGLDQVNARGLQRLEETARQAESDAIAVPLFEPPAGPEADRPRFASSGRGG